MINKQCEKGERKTTYFRSIFLKSFSIRIYHRLQHLYDSFNFLSFSLPLSISLMLFSENHLPQLIHQWVPLNLFNIVFDETEFNLLFSHFHLCKIEWIFFPSFTQTHIQPLAKWCVIVSLMVYIDSILTNCRKAHSKLHHLKNASFIFSLILFICPVFCCHSCT